MVPGLLPVTLSLLPGKPKGFVDERDGQIFVSPAIARQLRHIGCEFSTVDVYVDGRWRQQILGAVFP